MKNTQSVELKHMLNIAEEHRQKYEKGTYIFQEGMDAKALYVILKGSVQISKISSDGKELNLRLCTKNDICGELTLFTEDPKYLLSAYCLEDVEVAVVKKEVIEKEVFLNPDFGYELMKWMSDHFRRTQTKFRDLILHGKKGALYSTLIRLSNSYGVKKENGILIDKLITNTELGNFCCISRESTNKQLNKLKREGIISFQKGKILIHDIDHLRKEINCENCSAIYCNIE